MSTSGQIAGKNLQIMCASYMPDQAGVKLTESIQKTIQTQNGLADSSNFHGPLHTNQTNRKQQ